jgi:hypothetical protein
MSHATLFWRAFFKYLILGALVTLPVLLVLVRFLGVESGVALSIAVALGIAVLVLVPEVVKQFRRAR